MCRAALWYQILLVTETDLGANRSGTSCLCGPRCYETALLGPYSRLIAVEIASADAIHIDTRAGEFSHLFGPLPNPT